MPPGAVIAPVILASDKTSLSQFRGDQEAWPVYMTIGNISKDVRRQPSQHACVLLGYLPTAKLKCFSSGRRSVERYRLFHYCMTQILEPLVICGKEGVLMTCPNGLVQHGHVFLILAAYAEVYGHTRSMWRVDQVLCPCSTPNDEVPKEVRKW